MTGKQIWKTRIPDFSATDVEGVGRYRWEYELNSVGQGLTTGAGQKCYLWVYNNTGGALTAGNVYFHGSSGFQLTSGQNPTNFLEEVFTMTQAGKGTGLSMMAGVAISAIPAGQYGWIQVYGYNSQILMEGTVAIAATDLLKGVASQVYVVKDAATGTAPIARRHIMALAAKAGAGTALTAGFIFCI